MKLATTYDVLSEALSSVSSVVEDSLSSEEMKNIIFRVKKNNEVTIMGVNQLIIYRKYLDPANYSITVDEAEFGTSDILYIQLKSKELMGYLSTFKGLRTTKPTDIVFETIKTKVKVTVAEQSLEDERVLTSNWMFDNIPIRANIVSQLNMTIPEEGEKVIVDTNTILFYTANLLPIMANDGSNNMHNLLAFAKDYVVAYNASFNTLMNNHLPEAFSDITLNHRAISFMKNVICTVSSVEVCKSQSHLTFKTGDAEAFITYMTKLPNFQIHVDNFKKDHAIVLDRKYLKDVLKRLSLLNDAIAINLNMEDGVVNVSNSKFNQNLPILNSKGMDGLNNLRFNIMPAIINKAIIGDDAQFSSSLFIYLVPNGSNLAIIFADDSGQWFSIAGTRMTQTI